MKRFNIYIIGIFLIIVGTNCNETIKKQEQTTNNRNILYEPKLKKDVIENGSIESYETLSIYYMDYEILEEFMFYSLIMANDYNNVQATYDVFINIVLLYKHREDKISTNMAKMALEYLLKASKLGHHQALNRVKRYSITEKSDPKSVMLKILSE